MNSFDKSKFKSVVLAWFIDPHKTIPSFCAHLLNNNFYYLQLTFQSFQQFFGGLFFVFLNCEGAEHDVLPYFTSEYITTTKLTTISMIP